VLFHPPSSAILDAFMIGVNEAVGTKSAREAMPAAVRKVNAAIR
jgi:hypothetical protein